MKIWTKRAAGVSAIVGGLLIAGSVAASAADLPVVGGALNSLPLVGQATQQASKPADTAKQYTPAKAATPTQTATPKHAGKGNGEWREAHGILSGNSAGLAVGNVSGNVPVNVCGNGVNVLGAAGAAGNCEDISQEAFSAGKASVGDVDGDWNEAHGLGSGNTLKGALGDASLNAPLNGCGNAGNGALGFLAEGSCERVKQKAGSVGAANVDGHHG